MLGKRRMDASPTVWETENHKITYMQGDGCNIQLDGQTAMVTIKDRRSWKRNFAIFFSGALAGAVIGLLASVIMGIVFPV